MRGVVFFRQLISICALLGVACGSSPPPVAAHPKHAHKVAKEDTPESPAAHGSLPRRCARGRHSECVPPPGWVKRLCDDVYPDVALHMFRPGTPWKRLYMLARAEPFNASGGASLLGDRLERGEEVIALKRRGEGEGVQVGDTSGYDVLRWNGACATIHDGDFAEQEPNTVRHSKIEWRKLGLPVRSALEAEPDIAEAQEERRKACKGQSIGIVSDTCEADDNRFMDEIVRYVRGGAKLPPPAKMP
jgi:hypothetical protein